MVAVKKELKANNAYVAPELLETLANDLETAVFYRIEVTRDAEAAAERLRLKDEYSGHSCGDSDGTTETAMVIFGDVTFGKNYRYEYSNNGNMEEPEESIIDGDFNMNEPFAIVVDCRGSRNYDRSFSTVVIYSPEKIVNEEEYTAAKDAELAELCQLR